MIQPDTIKLLRNVTRASRWGTASIHDVMDYVKDEELKKLLEACKDKHRVLEREIEELLASYGDDGKEPTPWPRDVLDENQCPAGDERVGRHHRRADDGWMQYGREILGEISEPVCGGGRGGKRYHETAHGAGGAAGRGREAIPVMPVNVYM